jgi:hypothetical protein
MDSEYIKKSADFRSGRLNAQSAHSPTQTDEIQESSQKTANIPGCKSVATSTISSNALLTVRSSRRNKTYFLVFRNKTLKEAVRRNFVYCEYICLRLVLFEHKPINPKRKLFGGIGNN